MISQHSAALPQHSDVIIIGSGLAGLSAALFAARAGLTPVVLEKTRTVGGCSSWSHGATWVGDNHIARALGIPDNKVDVAAYLNFLGAGDNDPQRTRALIEHGPEALLALEEAGIEFNLVDGANDILAGVVVGAIANGRTLEPRPVFGCDLGDWRVKLRTPPDDIWRLTISEFMKLRKSKSSEHAAVADAVRRDRIGQGSALIAALLIQLRRHRVPVMTDTCAQELVVQDGRVAGVVLADGTRLSANRAVMLATGNYLSNARMVAAFENLPEYRSWAPEGSTGEGIQLAGNVGAAVGLTRNNRMLMFGYKDPNHECDYYAGEPSGIEIPRAHTLVVNRAGRRFGNEALFQEMAPAVRALDPLTRLPANLPCWLVFDSDYVAVWGFAGSAAGTVPDWVARTDSLSDLGNQLGIDSYGLEATVQRFNGFARSGVDEDFGRKPAWAITQGGGAGHNASLGTIARPPFYGVRLYPTGGASAGIRADCNARVLNWRGAPIAGLYAAGDVTHHDEFGAGYQAGVTFQSAFTFSHLAIKDLQSGAISRSAHANFR